MFYEYRLGEKVLKRENKEEILFFMKK